MNDAGTEDALANPEGATARAERVLVVGPGSLFLSGVSHYVARLGEALSGSTPTSLLLLRRLCPAFLYPGRKRLGQDLSTLSYGNATDVYDGVDWYWGPSLIRALRFWKRTAPTVVVLQWWTVTVAHTYLLLAALARRSGAALIVEFHEIQDVGESAVPLAARYARWAMGRILRTADAVVVHSDHDAKEAVRAYRIPPSIPVNVVLHGPYEHLAPSPGGADTGSPAATDASALSTERRPCRLLYAGVIREYKGLSELAGAMEILAASGERVHLTVAGEVWDDDEGSLPRLAALGPDVTDIVTEYLPDGDFSALFDRADVVVLPYRRSSASGPLHVAMSRGLPVVTTRVGGLVEAADGYTGAVLVPPLDPAALADGIRTARGLVSQEHRDVRSWQETADAFGRLIARIRNG